MTFLLVLLLYGVSHHHKGFIRPSQGNNKVKRLSEE